VALKAKVRFRGVEVNDCTIRDIAADGMYVETNGEEIPVGTQISVAYVSAWPEARQVCAKGLVVHSEKGGVGLLTREVDCGEAGNERVVAA
jgi:hypothetical protein